MNGKDKIEDHPPVGTDELANHAVLNTLKRLFSREKELSGNIDVVPAGEDDAGFGNRYNFVSVEDRNVSRRVTVGMVGDQKGSKSKCYTVIYGEAMAVVLPPDTDKSADDHLFMDYLDRIQLDKIIAAYLNENAADHLDIPALIPSLDLVIGKISTLDSSAHDKDRTHIRYFKGAIEKRTVINLFQNTFIKEHKAVFSWEDFFEKNKEGIYDELLVVTEENKAKMAHMIGNISQDMGGLKTKFGELQNMMKQALRIKESYKSLQSLFIVDNRYAFFLPLKEKRFFLGNILKELHRRMEANHHAVIVQLEERFNDEIGGKYVSGLYMEELMFWDVMHDLYSDYIKKIREKVGTFDKDLIYRYRNYFKQYVDTGTPGIGTDENAVPIQEIIDELLQHPGHTKTLANYKKIKARYIFDKTYSVDIKRSLGIIISNYIELLTRLKDKQIAIGDIKPENIFLTRGLEDRRINDRRINDRRINDRDFIFGLIDLETAVSLRSPENATSRTWGFTPKYSEISKLFSDKEIIRLYGEKELPNVYYFRDWHATMVCLYHAVTGEALFGKTTGVLLDAGDDLLNHGGRQGVIPWLMDYWTAAEEEFDRCLRAHEDSLRVVNVHLSGHSRTFIISKINDLIQSKISLILHIFDEEQHCNEMMMALQDDAKAISTYDILKCMFAIEYNFFYLEERYGGDIPEKTAAAGADHEDGDVT